MTVIKNEQGLGFFFITQRARETRSMSLDVMKGWLILSNNADLE